MACEWGGNGVKLCICANISKTIKKYRVISNPKRFSFGQMVFKLRYLKNNYFTSFPPLSHKKTDSPGRAIFYLLLRGRYGISRICRRVQFVLCLLGFNPNFTINYNLSHRLTSPLLGPCYHSVTPLRTRHETLLYRWCSVIVCCVGLVQLRTTMREWMGCVSCLPQPGFNFTSNCSALTDRPMAPTTTKCPTAGNYTYSLAHILEKTSPEHSSHYFLTATTSEGFT